LVIENELMVFGHKLLLNRKPIHSLWFSLVLCANTAVQLECFIVFHQDNL